MAPPKYVWRLTNLYGATTFSCMAPYKLLWHHNVWRHSIRMTLMVCRRSDLLITTWAMTCVLDKQPRALTPPNLYSAIILYGAIVICIAPPNLYGAIQIILYGATKICMALNKFVWRYSNSYHENCGATVISITKIYMAPAKIV